ncbi:ladinin-1 [Austrofundulus limnaeus]|uniref:Ladinin-1 n=1 Tax=Austrofundulus limnaeus TaxID=52670 RepID=A0A2I4C091_AUSLI|nr:PREDICTED: ladinin-1 [Austrofundulus limnaeus]
MSISRKNWSALSSLARQWTMEDEEEVERERRRRGRSSSTADPDDDSFSAPRKSSGSDAASGTESSSETSQGLSSTDQMQLDFVEMLRVRDERRRMRHVETLRRQKEEEEDGEKATSGGEGAGGLALLGDQDEEEGSVFKPQPPVKPSAGIPSYSNTRTDTATKQDRNEDVDKTPSFHSGQRTSSSKRSIKMERAASQQEKEESSRKHPEPDQKPVSNPTRKFVSSVSISLDKSSAPMSPSSPAGPFSPGERWPSPCQSPSSHGTQSPVQNGHTQETALNSPSADGVFEQTAKPAFTRQSSRTISFRMMKKKEEETAPLQRSASVRMASKKFEPDAADQNEDEDKTSFQRNSRQRISSRSIKEKMERLAQAAQKSEVARSPDVTQRTLVLLEEVSRKRSLFEKDEKDQNLTSPGASRQEFRSFTSGMSDRVNHWLNKNNQPGSPISLDLRHVDISSKRSLFENRGEESVSKGTPGKIYK